MRRPGQPHPEPRRLLHRARQRRGRDRRPRPRTARSTPSRRSAGTAGCRWPRARATAPRSPARTTTGSTASTGACSARRRWSARTTSTRRTGACPALAVELWQGFVFVNLDRDAAAARAHPGPLRAVPRALRPRRLRVPRHVHAHRPSVELEGHVRELQRRLPRQPAAPDHPGLLPERARRVPGAVGRRLERHLPHQRLHPHRRRVQRHHQGAPAGLPRPDRGGALALDVRAHPADAVPRHRARPGLLLHRRARRRPTPSTSRSATCSTRARSSTRCSTTCSR